MKTQNKQHPEANKPSVLAIFIILTCALFLVFKYMMNVSVSIMAPDLMAHFHIKGTGLGLLGTTYLFTYGLFQLFCSGVLLDSLNIRYVAIGSILISVLGLYLFAWSQDFTQALIGRGLQGVGAAFATVTYMKLTANWFHPRYFARITGFIATAAMIGAIAGDKPLEAINSVWGWQASIQVCLVFGLALALIFFLVVRTQPAIPPTQREEKSDTHRMTAQDIRTILKNPVNWLMLMYTGLAFAPVGVFANLWGNSFLHVAYHISHSDTPWYSTSIFLGLAIGGPLLGFISDKTNKRDLVMLLSSISSLVWSLLVIYCNQQTHVLLVLELFLIGISTGGFMLGFAVAKESSPLFLAATVMAFVNTGDPLFGSITDPLIGRILDAFSDHRLLNNTPLFTIHAYHIAMLVLVANLVLAIAVIAYISKRNRRIEHIKSSAI